MPARASGTSCISPDAGWDGIRIRRVLATDAAAVAAIYEPYVRETVITFEIDPPDETEMRRRIVETASRYPWLVLEDPDIVTDSGLSGDADSDPAHRLLGYAYASRFHERAAYRHSVSVTIYLRRDVRHRGYGRLLYAELLRLLREEGYHRAYAGVTQPNPSSMALHEAFGFLPAGRYEECGFKLGAWRTVVWLQLALTHNNAAPDETESDLPPETTAYRTWRDGPLFDGEIRDELAAIDGQEDEIRERFATSLTFGTAGLRGKMGAGTNRINRYTIARVTQAMALYLTEKEPGRVPTVVLGHDTRHGSEAFSRIAARVFAAHGVRVLRFPDYVPTPLLAFSVLHLGCDAGVMLTASHNPPAYNGYKVYFADGTQISEEDAAGVMALLRDDTRTGYDKLKYAAYDEAIRDGWIRELGNETETVYLEEVLKLAQRIEPDGGGHVPAHTPSEAPSKTASTPLRILYTPLSGTAGARMLRLLQADGFADVHAVASQMEPDPDFSRVSSPNPEFRAAFDRAEAEALASGADLVLATDPDGDRFTAMIPKPDGTYHHLTGNQTGAILAWYVLVGLRRQHRLPARAALVKTVVTDDLAAAIARAEGVYVHETLTGFKYICGDIPDLEARGYSYVMGFEESIGYAVGTLVRDKDGMSGGLLLCRAAAHLRRKGQTLWDLLTGLWTTYGYHAARPLNLVREGLDGQTEIAGIMAAFRERAPRRIGNARLVRSEDLVVGTAQKYSPDGTLMGPPEPLGFPRSDVLRFFFDDGSWYAVRPSGTEPKLKLYLYAVVPSASSENGVGEDPETLVQRGEDRLEQMHRAIRPLLGE